MHGMAGGGWDGALFGLLGGGQMFFMGLIPILLVGLVVWLAIEGSRRREPFPSVQSGSYPPYLDPRALLDERYARGEIDRDDYLQRRSDLGR